MEHREHDFLRVEQVAKMVSIGKTTVWVWSRAGKFPKPFKLSPSVTVWKAADVLAWMEAKANGETPCYE